MYALKLENGVLVFTLKILIIPSDKLVQRYFITFRKQNTLMNICKALIFLYPRNRRLRYPRQFCNLRLRVSFFFPCAFDLLSVHKLTPYISILTKFC